MMLDTTLDLHAGDTGALLKIDRSFVGGMKTNPQDRALITAAIDLARNFGLTIIAEGVETQDDSFSFIEPQARPTGSPR